MSDIELFFFEIVRCSSLAVIVFCATYIVSVVLGWIRDARDRRRVRRIMGLE